jgi:hypothetical protein
MFMFGVFESFISPNSEISKSENLNNTEYQLSIFKKFRNFTDLRDEELNI